MCLGSLKLALEHALKLALGLREQDSHGQRIGVPVNLPLSLLLENLPQFHSEEALHTVLLVSGSAGTERARYVVPVGRR